jgi:hypothetical protein
MRLSLVTFKYLWQLLALAISRINTNMIICIPMETKVVITLSRLRSGNTLLTYSEIYGVAIGTTSIIVKKC